MNLILSHQPHVLPEKLAWELGIPPDPRYYLLEMVAWFVVMRFAMFCRWWDLPCKPLRTKTYWQLLTYRFPLDLFTSEFFWSIFLVEKPTKSNKRFFHGLVMFGVNWSLKSFKKTKHVFDGFVVLIWKKSSDQSNEKLLGNKRSAKVGSSVFWVERFHYTKMAFLCWKNPGRKIHENLLFTWWIVDFNKW